VCDTQDVAAIDVALGDVDDNLSVASVQLPVTYSGGDGRDQVHYYSYDPPGGVAVAIDNDGVADDGPASRDNVMEDVEWLWGSSLNDTIGSGGNGASIWLGGGDDTGRGGGGDDVITSVSWSAGFNGPKLTWELSADGRDTVACGAGNDAVVGDGRDRVARDCEIVGREIPGARTGPRYEFLATARDDKVALARIVDAQWTSTLVRAGAGNDRIDARDTNRGAGVNAVIRCGSGRDKVYADAGDRVSRDCERVLR
jgi:hypothetical protein